MPEFTKNPSQVEAVRRMAKYMHFLLYGGSRSGKSVIFLRTLIARAIRHKSSHVVLRKHLDHVVSSIWMETLPFCLDVCGLARTVKLNHTKHYVTFPNKSIIYLGGLDDKERTDKILGREFSTIWFNECSEISWDSVQTALSRLAERSGLAPRAWYDCNPPNKKHWTYNVFRELLNPKERTALPKRLYGCMKINPQENAHNLADGYIDNVLGIMTGNKRKRFMDGEWTDDSEGALWTSELIGAYRVKEDRVPDLVRIIVGVDPNVSDNPNSDECGIVVAGLGVNEHVYVLADCTVAGGPREWALAVVAAYKKYEADLVVGEVNNGGDLVEINLRTVEEDLSYESIRATRGKIKRAEPVAALYERGIVHHAGEFPELEAEMTTWNPELDATEKDWSPNRMDALVWTVTKLKLDNSRPYIYTPEQPTDKRSDIEKQFAISERIRDMIANEPDSVKRAEMEEYARGL
jgi:phage terminase large subunit-like protein